MIFTKIELSPTMPSYRNVLWLKPVDGGVTMLVPGNGGWDPLITINNNGTVNIVDDIIKTIVGKAGDKKTADTVNGAKAYAKDMADAVVGKASDKSSAKTIYGLKAYIDEQIASLGE